MVTLHFAESLQSGNWSLTSASGSYTEPAQPENHYPGCSATLTRNAAAAAMLGSYGPNVVALKSGYWTVELFPPTYWGVQGDPVNSSATTGDCATSARVDYAGLSQSLHGAQCHFDPSAGNTEAIDFSVSSSYTVPDNCTGTITSNTVVYNVTLQSSVTFTSPGVVSPGSTQPQPPTVLPPKPDKNELQISYAIAERAWYELCGDWEYYGWINAVHHAEVYSTGWMKLGCDQAIARLQEIYDAFAKDPPDSHYSEIALPRRWPVPPPRALSCAGARSHGACLRADSALKARAAADARLTELWDVLAMTANRWGDAYAAFYSSSSAPQGLALQTALSKAYFGELGPALAGETKAGKALASALRGAGLGRVSVTAKQRQGAQRLLDESAPPGWLVDRLVSDGVVTSAAALRADWHSLMTSIKIPASVDLGSSFSRVGSVPQIPGETYRSMTLDDLYWIADAVSGTAARAALTKDVTDALGASSASHKHSALESFLAYAKQHEHGELLLLLQTAAAPLLG